MNTAPMMTRRVEPLYRNIWTRPISIANDAHADVHLGGVQSAQASVRGAARAKAVYGGQNRGKRDACDENPLEPYDGIVDGRTVFSFERTGSPAFFAIVP